MNQTPAISVLLPVFNGRASLDMAVGSILMQTFRDFELLAIDDGSTDGSLQLLQDYARMDSRLRVISREHTGETDALNHGLAEAAGEFVARMDADDISLPGRFEKQIGFLRQHNDVVLVGGRVLLIDSSGQSLFETNQPTEHGAIQHALLSGIELVIVHPSVMARTAALRAAGGYRPEYSPCEELDLTVRLSEAGHLANLPEVLLHYRQYDQSGVSSNADDATRRLLTEAFDRRGVRMADDWKPSGKSVLSPSQQARLRALLALKAGNIPVARKHAYALLKKNPLSIGSWQLAYSALRGST